MSNPFTPREAASLDRYITSEPAQIIPCDYCGTRQNRDTMTETEDLSFCNKLCEARFNEEKTISNLEEQE